MAFTSVDDFQTALNACVSVRDWETLTESIQIPEVMVPMAYARLAELTLEEIEVSFIIIGLLAPFTPYNIVSLRWCFISFLIAWWEPGIHGCDYKPSKSLSGRYGKFNVFKLWC